MANFAKPENALKRADGKLRIVSFTAHALGLAIRSHELVSGCMK